MNILTIPYITGGLSHLIPLYVLQQKYLRNTIGIKNQFLVNRNSQQLLTMQGINCLPIDYTFESNDLEGLSRLKDEVVKMEKVAFDMVKPSIIIEDTSFYSPLIAEKNQIPRISIQRTGVFRSIDKRYRNANHIHSLEKGSDVNRTEKKSVSHHEEESNDSDFTFLQQYARPKVKIIPGIPTIERLPEKIENRESYFYSGPLIVMDKPSKNLSERLTAFLEVNNGKPIVFITTGTIDKTPIEDFIAFFVQRNYAVITTCKCEINETYNQEIFYNKLLPLHYICGISNLVIHQCGSGIYHYPLMNHVPSLTMGTQCYDREDIAQRLQELGVSGHIPHPEDNPDYWNVFLELFNRFEQQELIDNKMMEKLRVEIDETMANFDMEKVIQYALT